MFRTPDKNTTVALAGLRVFPIDPGTNKPTTWAAVASRFPGIEFPGTADVEVALHGDQLNVKWKTNIGTEGNATLPRSEASKDSTYAPLADVKTWDQFKNFIGGLNHRQYIFRGQKHRNRLRTRFHRSGRADLAWYQEVDIPALYKHLSSRTTHIFNLAIADEYGAFFNLAQHHGYPTPLLDWTYSPYVGAFFAYRHILNSEADVADDDKMVRIFVFDQLTWRARRHQSIVLSPFRPHFSLMEFVAIENPRTIPQQSISSVTNVDDIEGHIREHERVLQLPFLRVIDLPHRERRRVMQDLSTMGITAGSLFPGFDGACEELRERYFDL
jgi:hypothetical protein